ncbi:type II secretion system protein GspG [Verrucomicrobiota bacterium sgz303538]
MLSVALNGYRAEFGHLPPPQEYWSELQRARMLWESLHPGPPLDDWGRPFVYRVPGRHGDFDLFSCGPDGPRRRF